MCKERRMALFLHFGNDTKPFLVCICCDPWRVHWSSWKQFETFGKHWIREVNGGTCNSGIKMNFCQETQLSYNCLNSDVNPFPSRISVGDRWKGYFKICLSLPIWKFAQEKEESQKNIMMETSKFRQTLRATLIEQAPITVKISSLIITVTAILNVFSLVSVAVIK